MSPGWSSSALSPWIHRGDLSTSHSCSVQCRGAWPDTGGCGPTMGHLATADGKGLGLWLSACLWSGFVPGFLCHGRVWFAAGFSAPLTFLPVQARSPISTCWQQLQCQVVSLGEELVAHVQDSPSLCTKRGESTMD